MKSVPSALNAKVGQNDRPIADSKCTSNKTSDHAVGDIASSLTVKVSVRCILPVFSYLEILNKSTNLLTQQTESYFGTAYTQVGNTQINQVQTVVDTKTGSVVLLVNALGKWVHHFGESLEHRLANVIAGKDKKDAEDFLASEQGVKSINIAISNGDESTLPSDPGRIMFITED